MRTNNPRDLLGLAGINETWIEAHFKQDNSNGETVNELQASGEGSLPYIQDKDIDDFEKVTEIIVS